jgi:four helix bundle protein
MKLNELHVWREAVALVVSIYRLTAEFPAEERYDLTRQIRRAAVSVASNIAEGEGRRGHRDHARFVLNARGSLYEVRTQLVISRELGYVADEVLAVMIAKIDDVGRLINGTLRFLSANREAPSAKR